MTGASGGIGLELARELAQDGFNLALVARSKDRLQAAAEELAASHGIDARIFNADLTRPAAPDETVQWLYREGIAPEVLVNNAGFGLNGRFAENDPQSEADLVQLNVACLARLCRLLLPGMIERGRGGVLNVASVAGFPPGPGMSSYYASKAYVLHFTEGLAVELRGSGVTATALCPGPTQSDFFARASMQDTPLGQGKLQPIMDAADVARIGYAGFRKGRTVVIPGLMNKLSAQSVRISPRALAAWIAGRINGLR